MNEAEWLASNDPAVMGAAVTRRKRASARVLRLYMAAFWSWQSQRLTTADERDRLRQRAEWVEEWADSGTPPAEAADRTSFVFYNSDPKAGFLSTVRAPAQWNSGGPAKERAVWALREVFGNPFATRRKRKGAPHRGWMFSAPWRTDTVLALARQMYQSRDFGAMPILADALQDAGCDNEDVLTHCREPGEHVRGCWVLDLVLEKA
jgi:hypothetical protein